MLSMAKGINVLSLFDVMSCGQTALDRLGVPVNRYIASEIDKYAIQVTQHNYPLTEHIGSVVDVDAANLPEIDLLIGGSPCQGFSFAGKQLNFEDPRSALFFEFVRLLNDTLPRYFLLENVKMKKEYQDIISGYLGCEPIEINSSLVSAQNRKRLYWTNILVVGELTDKKIYLKDILEHGFADRDKSFCITASVGRTTSREYFKKNQGGLIALGNTHPSGKGMNGQVYSIEGKAPTLTTNKGEGNKIGVISSHTEEYTGPIYKVKFLDGKYVLYRKLTPLECERLQTVPEGYTAQVSNTQRYKMLANGWTIEVIMHLLKGLKN